MSEQQAMEETLFQDPTDHVVRNVLADLHEEEGRDEEAASLHSEDASEWGIHPFSLGDLYYLGMQDQGQLNGLIRILRRQAEWSAVDASDDGPWVLCSPVLSRESLEDRISPDVLREISVDTCLFVDLSLLPDAMMSGGLFAAICDRADVVIETAMGRYPCFYQQERLLAVWREEISNYLESQNE